jgi:uncharacterized GH25 family protein
MYRMFGALVVGLFAVAAAHGHFTFVVPDASGSSAKLIFSDDLNPDTNVSVEKIAGTKLTLRDAAGKDTPLELKKGEGCYLVSLPGSGPRVVFGTTDYGVMQKGDAKPYLLVYYPKALVGEVPAKAATVGARLEVVPAGEPGKPRFRVLADGKPAAEAEVTVLVPGSAKQMVKTDKEGLTPAFAASGRYGVFARWTEAKSGEHAGKKYEEVRHYATLVADVGK